MMNHATRITVLLLAASALLGCESNPVESDEPGTIVQSCCAAARERVTREKDIASEDFRDHCDACRRGRSKSGCAAAAAKVYDTVKGAYGEFSMPGTCNTLKSSLREQGIDVN